jgi:transposase
MPKKITKRRRYTSEFKAEAVRLVEQRGERTVAEIAHSLGVAENILHAWKRQHEPGQSNDRGESAEQELHRLRRENGELKRDRDALVKSIAVFVRDRR